MAEGNARPPRVFIVRHGETPWSKTGQFTSTTEVHLTEHGKAQVTTAKKLLVGHGKLIDPESLLHVFVSPRVRATETLHILLPSLSPHDIIETEELAEWDYGRYEGLTKGEIRVLRKEERWEVWDGCEGGESMDDITRRLDKFVEKIKSIHHSNMNAEGRTDIVIVGHGLFLRCFVKHWLGFQICDPLALIFEPGGIATLSYKNTSLKEPALYLGHSLPPES